MGILKRFNEVFKISNSSKKITESDIGLVARPKTLAFDPKEVDNEISNEQMHVQYRSAYLHFPLVNSIIETVVSHDVQDFYFEGPDMKKLDKLKQDANLWQVFNEIDRVRQINGFCPVEMNKNGNKFSFKVLNPKGFVIYRRITGEVIGYSMKDMVLWGTTGDLEKDKNFKNKVLSIESIAVIKRGVIDSSDKYGTSRIHNMLQMIMSKESAESNLNVLFERYANPIIDISVGNEQFTPSNSVISTVKNDLENLRSDTDFVHSWLINTKVLGFDGKALDSKSITTHIDQQIITGGMVPPELLGYPSDSSAEVRLRSFGRHIKSEQRSLKHQIEDQILPFITGNNKNEIQWGSVEEREKEMDFDIIRGLVKDGIITAQKGNDLLPPKFQEKLPENPVPSLSDDGETIAKRTTDPTKTTGEFGNEQKRTDIKVPMDDKNGIKKKQPKVKRDGLPK